MDQERTKQIADRYISRGGDHPIAGVALPGKPIRPRRNPATRYNKPGTLTELTPKHNLIIDYMVNGLPRPHVGLQLPSGTPLSAEQVAKVLNVSPRYVRRLTAEKTFQAGLTQAINSLRTGAAPKAMHKIIDLIHIEGEGKAADRKVQLQAAQTILGEQAGGVSVNVQVNNQTNITPGYVIRLPQLDTPNTPTPITIDQ